ncbi:GTPase IMAP family member 8-like [Myxocyprinus asiaticus]|uniref:GTPase IMAP family member 8-like n=1 Tax=Myxocyprinus asiaticus TaxID=70543 RepID=UPI002221DB92|nr:GTPase IMAP family member 8-like [Myxocyprinus asiaticus]XP_051536411.1 GTPase IMAP family member 8-like [Myxocyprinus asiaticus]
MSEQRTGHDMVVLEGSSTSGSNKRLSEIRIIMIGGRELEGKNASGKSSAGNIILGRNVFDVGRRTARSVQARGEVHGRHVTVVDAPGWWWHYAVENTPMFDRLEIMRSPILCPPGPHAFLLVIPVDSVFPKVYRMALEEHLVEILSKNVWSHIIVLFSSIAPYNDITLKNNLRNWPDLQWLLKKCQNRYHVLNINNSDDSSQVITLLEKIEKMVSQNNGHHFKISKRVSAAEKSKKAANEKAKQRILAVNRQRTELQARIRDQEQHLTAIHIVILGASWAARSSAGNLILGEEAFQVDESRTTVSCEVSYARVHGRHLTVVDTPGWLYQYPLKKTSELDKLEIRRSVYLCPPGPHAFLLTVPIATAFNKSYQKAVEEHMGLLGEKVWNHTIVLFTRGDWLGDTTIEDRIEIEGEHLQWLMEKCRNRYQVLNCKKQTDTIQVTELLEKIEEMVMENNGCHYVPDEESNPSTELDLKLRKAKIYMMQESRQRDFLQLLLKALERKNNLTEVRIVLLGGEGAGKSMSGNIILHGPFFENTVLEGFKTPTRTRQCMMKQRKVERWQVSVVDTPGWSTSTLENAKEILRSVTVCSPGPHAFLLVLPVCESFTKKSQQTAYELMKLFGECVWRHTIILFSGHWLKDRPVEEYIECEGEALQELIIKCGNRYVLLSDWGNRSQVKNLLKMIEEMVARNRGENFTLEKKERQPKLLQWITGKTLTEEEWNKREDELIDKALKAALVNHRRRGSFEHPIPSMSGESLSDSSSLFGAEVLNPAVRVSQWLWHPRSDGTSSGYETISTTSSSQDPNNESVRDNILVHQHHHIDMDTLKHGSNMREQKHARSHSL